MKNLSLYTLSMVTFMSIGCSSANKIVSVSDSHYYDENFGLVRNDDADRQLQQELLLTSLPAEVDMPIDMDAEWTMNFRKDADAFYAHEYVQQPEVISYKYKFDKKFYDHAEWRSGEF